MTTKSIAIDGPAGAGKSSPARCLAAHLGFLYVDTGAIYRTVGLFAARNGVSCTAHEAVIALLPQLRIELCHGEDGAQRMLLAGEDVTQAIRDNRVSQYASQVSAIPEVRQYLLEMQRDLARRQAVVMDGRDIGSVVLPQAGLKIFLTASAACRAERRYRELLEKGSELTYKQVLEELQARDAADYGRAVAPLRQAEDAILLDSSDLSLEETLTEMLRMAKERFGL